MLVKVKDLAGFEASVFGADCFVENWPHILTTGIEVEKRKYHDGKFRYYVMIDGRKASDSAFFTFKEMKYLEEVVG